VTYNYCGNQCGGTIKLTGMLNVPKTSHKWCFESSLKVCAKQVKVLLQRLAAHCTAL
jgi:hypothetical protein